MLGALNAHNNSYSFASNSSIILELAHISLDWFGSLEF